MCFCRSFCKISPVNEAQQRRQQPARARVAIPSIRSMSRVFWVWPVLFGVIEIILRSQDLRIGLALYAVVALMLILNRAFFSTAQPQGSLDLALLLVPLTRLISHALPLHLISRDAWVLASSVPMLVATTFAISYMQPVHAMLPLRFGNLLVQGMLALGGFGLGALIGPLAPLLSLQTVGVEGVSAAASNDVPWLIQAISPAAGLFLAGICEELILRGLVQPMAGRGGVIYAALLSAALNLGSLSLARVGLVFVVSLLLGLAVQWSRSVSGVALAHGVINVVVLLLWPHASVHSDGLLAAVLPWLVGVGGLTFIAALVILALKPAQGTTRDIDLAPTTSQTPSA